MFALVLAAEALYAAVMAYLWTRLEVSVMQLEEGATLSSGDLLAMAAPRVAVAVALGVGAVGAWRRQAAPAGAGSVLQRIAIAAAIGVNLLAAGLSFSCLLTCDALEPLEVVGEMIVIVVGATVGVVGVRVLKASLTSGQSGTPRARRGT